MKKIKKKYSKVQSDRNIIDVLLLDHRDLKDACDQFMNLGGDRKLKYQLAKKFVENFYLHIMAEEKVVYGDLKNRIEFKQFCQEANVEHEVFKNRVTKIRSLMRKSKTFKEDLEIQLKVLSQLVKNHLMAEESEIFPMMQEKLDRTELYDLGRRFLMKRKLDLDNLGTYPILEDEIISWKDSVQKLSSEILSRMNKHVEELRH